MSIINEFLVKQEILYYITELLNNSLSTDGYEEWIHSEEIPFILEKLSNKLDKIFINDKT